MRWLVRMLVLVLAAYGPLAPALLLFLLAVPPLVLLSGWPCWVKVLLLANDVGLILGVALLLGPGMMQESGGHSSWSGARDESPWPAQTRRRDSADGGGPRPPA